MKKFKLLSFALVAVMLLGVTPSYAANGPYNIGEIKGTPRKQGEPVRTYKLVRYSTRGANITSLASNDVVIYDLASDDSVSVRRNTASAEAAVAGVVDMTILTPDSASTSAFDDAGKRNWGYIIVHGPATVKTQAGGTNGNVAGAIWVTSRDAGSATTLEAVSSNDVSSVGNFAKASSAFGGFFYQTADAAATTASVFVRLE